MSHRSHRSHRFIFKGTQEMKEIKEMFFSEARFLLSPRMRTLDARSHSVNTWSMNCWGVKILTGPSVAELKSEILKDTKASQPTF